MSRVQRDRTPRVPSAPRAAICAVASRDVGSLRALAVLLRVRVPRSPPSGLSAGAPLHRELRAAHHSERVHRVRLLPRVCERSLVEDGGSVRTIAITNQKGGSAKTTSAVNIAAALGESGKKVLVVDLDPQASASSWLGVKDGGRGLLDLFLEGGSLADLVRASSAPGVDVAPSSAWLVGAEKALASEPGAEAVLRRAVSRLPKKWDFVLLDCPPSLGVLALNALVASREVLVPVEAHAMALSGLVQLTKTVETVRDRLAPDLEVSGILACRVTRTRLAGEVVDRLRESFGKLVFRTVIRESVRLAEAPSFSKPITAYAPESPGAEDYRAVARELTKRSKTA